jgi:hypothetical protein
VATRRSKTFAKDNDRVCEIEFDHPGAEAFAFTFG